MAWNSPSNHVWTTGETVSAANMNTYIGNDINYLYGDASWTAPTYTNSWVDGTEPVGFRADGHKVFFRGVMKSGTIAAAAFTLPVGYRPGQTVNWAAWNNGTAVTQLQVTTAGVVTAVTGVNTVVSFGGLNFDTV